MSIEIRMKMSPLETGKLYMKSVQMERQLAEANKAMMRAKTTKGWDSIPHEIHKHIDAVFEAIARE